MADNRLNVTFEGPGVHEGVSISDLSNTLTRVQKAVRLMVEHLAGVESKAGRPREWVRRRSELKLRGTSPGSLVAELELASSSIDNHKQMEFYDYGGDAISAILDWKADGASLPTNVADEFFGIYSGLSPNIDSVALGDSQGRRRLTIPRIASRRASNAPSQTYENANIWGYLMAVDWTNKTARLERIVGKPVPLKFGDELAEDMRRFATEYAQIRGEGVISAADDEWVSVNVTSIEGDRDPYKPFDMEEFLAQPSKPFRFEDLKPPSEPFDVDEFNRIIREGRDV